MIPTAVYPTAYKGDVPEFMAMPLQELVEQIADGALPVPIVVVVHIAQIVQLHQR